jgi:hypothetical protein
MALGSTTRSCDEGLTVLPSLCAACPAGAHTLHRKGGGITTSRLFFCLDSRQRLRVVSGCDTDDGDSQSGDHAEQCRGEVACDSPYSEARAGISCAGWRCPGKTGQIRQRPKSRPPFVAVSGERAGSRSSHLVPCPGPKLRASKRESMALLKQRRVERSSLVSSRAGWPQGTPLPGLGSAFVYYCSNNVLGALRQRLTSSN